MMNAAFRVDPGLAFEMQREIEIERDFYTLFSFALDQTGATDIRRCAANRLNELSELEVINFIRTDASHEMCEAMTRSNLFPLTFKSFARAALGRPEP